MKLETYLSQEITTKIKKHHIKDTCEWCDDNAEGLMIIPDHPLSVYIAYTLETLGLKYKDTTEYEDGEMIRIKCFILGLHNYIEVITVCGECYLDIHTNDDSGYELPKEVMKEVLDYIGFNKNN